MSLFLCKYFLKHQESPFVLPTLLWLLMVMSFMSTALAINSVQNYLTSN